MNLSELSNKNIVNVLNGRNIGNIIDVKIKTDGSIESLVIKPNNNFFQVFNKEEETLIKWSDIDKIGEDVILVKISL